MADEKDAKPKGDGDKKALNPVLLLLIGAVAGGAGVVFLVPPKETVKVVGPPTPVIEQVELPDPFEFSFNPKSERGHRSALVSFYIVYKQDKNQEEEVTRLLRTNWNRAYSRCTEVLKNTPVEMYGSMEGMRKLRQRLKDELSASLFPTGIASVDDILWKKFTVQ